MAAKNNISKYVKISVYLRVNLSSDVSMRHIYHMILVNWKSKMAAIFKMAPKLSTQQQSMATFPGVTVDEDSSLLSILL